MRNFENVAKLIKRKRQEHPKKYSQSELSSLLGYKNGQFISNVERGLCSVPLKMLYQVTRILEISWEEMRQSLLDDYGDTIDAHFESVEGRVSGSQSEQNFSGQSISNRKVVFN